ncbi:thioredoxin-like protein [Hypoxylon trugodes]|uniref:thioredoxin-like protein n=1 Tax=Hypoxylon trugodes TaxID=326681 RepID=UPI0021A1CABE|nr:thioredoxin-like protein [Hypoxylon trugodes]KAI1393255.1 thioredoxin-like protein [Hypoxylon trugodes]
MTSTSANANINPTPAQEEFQDFLEKNTDKGSRVHPEDRDHARREAENSDEDEEDRFRNAQIEAAMRVPTLNGDVKLPPASFDSGRSTGVKGVIADARAYEQARQSKWRNRVRAARQSVFGKGDLSRTSESHSGESDGDEDEDAFLKEWREARRQELEREARNGIRNRRTSPSLRMFGRLDTVDALGYLDAIEKVGRETVVVVFVYDHECEVSRLIESTLRPLVTEHPEVHFVKVHYEDIEFDNAAVPTILAYRNQGDLFANLTGIIDMIPDDEDFDSDSLKKIFIKNSII